MIFLCFSVGDRFPIINDFFQYLLNFGLNIWYDRRNIYWGDDRYEENIVHGVANKSVHYAVIFYSENFRNGNICLDEYSILEKRFSAGELHLFPVFIGEVPTSLEERFALCKKLVFKQVSDHRDYHNLGLHILAKITSDEVEKARYGSIKDILLNFEDKSYLAYKLLVEYDNVDKQNYAMRVGMLFLIYEVLSSPKYNSYMHFKTMRYLFYRNCGVTFCEEKRELQIMENIVIYEFGSLL